MNRVVIIFLVVALLLFFTVQSIIDLPLPIEITYRPGPIAQDYLVTIHNKSDRFLNLALQIKNPTTEEGKISGVQLQPFESKDIDWKGFKVESGDGILVVSGGYKKTVFKVP